MLKTKWMTYREKSSQTRLSGAVQVRVNANQPYLIELIRVSHS